MTEVGWKRLDRDSDNRFRRQQAALLGYACATLPTRFSRRVVSMPSGEIDPNAMPVEIWLKGVQDVAFVWLVRHEKSSDSEPWRVVGFLRQGSGYCVEHCDLSVDGRVPKVFDAKPVRFSDQFWRSDLTRQAPVTETERNESVDVERIRLAHEKIDDAFRKAITTETALSMTMFRLVLPSTDFLTTSWRPLHDSVERKYVAELLDRRVCNFRFDANAVDTMVLLERDVPFYKGCRLYRIIDRRGPRSRFTSFVLHEETEDFAPLESHARPSDKFRNRCSAKGELHIDKFRSRLCKRMLPIDNFHRRRSIRGELRIDKSSLGAYLRFYCEFMHGKEEIFSIIECTEHLRWVSPAESQQEAVALRQLFTKVLMPVAIYQPHFADPASGSSSQHSANSENSSSMFERPSTIYCRAYVSCGRFLFVTGIAVQPDGNFDKFEGCVLHATDLPIQAHSDHVQSGFVLRMDTL